MAPLIYFLVIILPLTHGLDTYDTERAIPSMTVVRKTKLKTSFGPWTQIGIWVRRGLVDKQLRDWSFHKLLDTSRIVWYSFLETGFFGDKLTNVLKYLQPELIRYWGYDIEEHFVTTEDGYILGKAIYLRLADVKLFLYQSYILIR